jgi:hypothetical protein
MIYFETMKFGNKLRNKRIYSVNTKVLWNEIKQKITRSSSWLGMGTSIKTMTWLEYFYEFKPNQLSKSENM